MAITSAAQTQLDLIKQDTNPSKATVKTTSDNLSKADAANNKISDDKDNFLLLLTTQLKNQDPTEPLDTNDFTNQLVQFNIAEQSVAANKNLETLIDFQKASQLQTAVDYIGKTVDAKGNAGELSNGFGSFIYSLAAPAKTASVVITDGAGRAVFSGQGPVAQGKNRVVWDGVNSFNGADELDGTYTINVVAKDAAGKTVTATTYTTGIVTSAETRDGETVLNVAGTDVKLADVSTVRATTQFVPEEDSTDGGDEDSTAGDTDNTDSTTGGDAT